MTPEDYAAYTAAAVRGYLAAAGLYLEAVAQQNPQLTVTQLLSRADVRASLAQAFADAEQYVREQVREAWEQNEGDPFSPVLAELLRDVGSIYGPGSSAHWGSQLRKSGKPPREVIETHARQAALRNSMTAWYAARAARTESQLDQAAAIASQPLESLFARPRKRWKVHPQNPACCFWCRRLHGVTIGLHESFLSHLGGPAALSGTGRLTQPPRPYMGRLQAPPLHPWCECELEILTREVEPGRVPGETREGPSALPSLVAAADIRAMPDEKYRLLMAYLRAAMHELGLLLQRLASDTRT